MSPRQWASIPGPHGPPRRRGPSSTTTALGGWALAPLECGGGGRHRSSQRPAGKGACVKSFVLKNRERRGEVLAHRGLDACGVALVQRIENSVMLAKGKLLARLRLGRCSEAGAQLEVPRTRVERQQNLVARGDDGLAVEVAIRGEEPLGAVEGGPHLALRGAHRRESSGERIRLAQQVSDGKTLDEEACLQELERVTR